MNTIQVLHVCDIHVFEEYYVVLCPIIHINCGYRRIYSKDGFEKRKGEEGVVHIGIATLNPAHSLAIETEGRQYEETTDTGLADALFGFRG